MKEGEHPVYSTSGTVYYDGQPLDGARVMWYPEDDTMPPATATTDDNGEFVLTTYNAEDGAVAGKFKVTVKKMKPGEEIDNENPPENPEDPRYRPQSLIPEFYGDKDQTDLSAEVTQDGANEFEFKLEPQ